jgi:hypothetical protein
VLSVSVRTEALSPGGAAVGGAEEVPGGRLGTRHELTSRASRFLPYDPIRWGTRP